MTIGESLRQEENRGHFPKSLESVEAGSAGEMPGV
jgi:hypothetical protein